MFSPPPEPNDEYETTSVVIPLDATPEQIAEVLEDICGRVNIIQGIMFRDLPDCLSKSSLPTTWCGLYWNFMKKNRIFAVSGATGTTFSNGDFLSADLSAWDQTDPKRCHSFFVSQNLMQKGPAPNWVMDFVWHSELNKPRKGIDKVLNHYFTAVGTDNTRVDEAWLLVVHQDVPILHKKPPLPCLLIRLLRWLSYNPYIGLIFLLLLAYMEYLTGVQGWTRRTVLRDTAPDDPTVPYFIVYFRQQNVNKHCYGYYWLQWHESFVAPTPSLFHRAPPVSANNFLEMVVGF